MAAVRLGIPATIAGVRRLVNDGMYFLALAHGAVDRPSSYLCECGRPLCAGVVRLTGDDYDVARPGTIVAHR